MLNSIKPILRTIKLAHLRQSAQRIARTPCPADEHPAPPAPSFIVGCGRSGTTLLGRLFSAHPEVCYLREPYHIWGAIDPRSDVNQLHYESIDTILFMDETHYSHEARIRFNRLVIGARDRAGMRTVIEKTPHNAMRIAYLEALTDQARYVHIVRDGINVVRSIQRIAEVSAYKMYGKPHYNQWWGTNHRKWQRLSTEGAARGYYPDEISLLRNDGQKGAYEWLVSLGELDRYRDRLGDRLFEVTYSELTGASDQTLHVLCEHLQISCPDRWLADSIRQIGPERVNPGPPLQLPEAMCSAFNEYQTHYGFEGRAEPLPSAVDRRVGV